jgi:hypothetical protein
LETSFTWGYFSPTLEWSDQKLPLPVFVNLLNPSLDHGEKLPKDLLKFSPE